MGPDSPAGPEPTRLDIWLDVACLCKTRSEAQKACKGGKVEVNGQPAKARKADAKTSPKAGEMKVTLSALMGTTMTISNNSKFDYAYRATLVLPGGKAGPAKSCAVPANGRLAMEHWKQRVEAVRLSDFKPAPAGSLCP